MKKLLLAAKEENERTRYFTEVMSDEYEIILCKDEEQIRKQLVEDAHLEALIVDAPSSVPTSIDLINYLKGHNNFLFSIPAMCLTDDEHMAADEKFLDNTVIGLIEKGDSKKFIVQKIAIAVNVINSVTFSDFSQMLKALPSLIYLKDAKGRYVFCSQYLSHLDRPDDPNWSIRGKTDLEIRRDQDNARKAYESDMRIVATGKGTSYVIEEDAGDSTKEYLQLIKEPLFAEDGSVRGIIAVINNVTEQELLKRELRKRSITDELTGLQNRASFDEHILALQSHMYPLSVISADCDGLKNVNDNYGHTVGDEYLRMSATLFKTVLPHDALIFRTGGDEFVFLLPGVDAQKAHEYVEKLEKDAQTFIIKDKTLSVSFGSHTINNNEESFSEALDASDEDMYRNKRAKKARLAEKEK